LSRNKQGELFVLSRGLNPGIIQLEPERSVFVDSYRGEPLDCVGGIVNDLAADAKGGVYFTISAAGFYYATPEGEATRYGDNVVGTNGILLSPDEEVLYVTNGSVVVAFDVEVDGSLRNQRDFATLSTGGGDGMAVDSQGKLFVSNGSGVDVFDTRGRFLGNIPGPQGLHGVVFSGKDKRYLYAIVLRGAFQGSPDNWIIRIPVLSQGYLGRAK
jgi:gluconolactonase